MPKVKKASLKATSSVSKTSILIFGAIFVCLGGYLIFHAFALNPNLPGDVNNDNAVNSSDLTLLLANFGTAYPAADFNNSGKVDAGDFSVILSNFSRTYTGTSSSSTSSSSSSGGATSDIAPESACPNQSNGSATNAVQVTAMICMTNYARNVDGGLVALKANTPLTSAAVSKNSDIISCNDFSHTACGKAFDYYIHLYGYVGNCWGENIAYGYQTVHDTFVAWMNSSGHRANILYTTYRDVGEATTTWPNNGPLWTTDFGGC